MYRSLPMVPRFCKPMSWMQNSCRGMKWGPPCRSSRQIYPFRGNRFWDFPGNSISPFRAFDEQFKNMMNQFERAVGPRFFDEFGGLRTDEAQVKHTKKEYEVIVDVSHFEPENIKITITKDKLVITGKHEHKADEHGFVSREFTREFAIPENVDVESITSGLTDDGILHIRGKVKGVEEGKEREIKINFDKDTNKTE